MAETSSLRFPALEKPVNEFIQEQETRKHVIKNAERHRHFNGTFEWQE